MIPHISSTLPLPLRSRTTAAWRGLRRTAIALLLVASGGLVVHANERPPVALPEVSGPYGVGVVDLPLTDSSRAGEYSDGSTSAGREIMVRVWYPARTRSRMPTTAYLDTISAEYLAGMVPELPVPATEDIATHSVAGARLQRGCQTLPVVLFSPGLQGVVAFYQSLLEDLASQGYIVFGVDSPDVSGVTVFPDGHIHRQVMPDESDDDDTFDEYAAALAAADLQFVARQLPRLNRDANLPFAGALNLHAVAAVGHSIGGAAAVEACLGDPAIRTAINLDGSFRGERYKQPLRKPILYVAASDHPDDPTVKTFLANVRPGSAAVSIAGTGHWSFTDLGILIEANGGDTASMGLFGTIATVRAVHIARGVTRSFLDSTLALGCGGFSRWSLRKWPEVSFQSNSR